MQPVSFILSMRKRLTIFLFRRFFTAIRILFLFMLVAAFFIGPACSEEVENRQTETIRIGYSEGFLSADISNAPMSQVLAELGQKTGVRVDAGDDLEEKVSLSVSGLSVEAFLERLCENRALVYERDPRTGAFRLVRAGAFVGSKEKPPAGSQAATGVAGKKVTAQRASIPETNTSSPDGNPPTVKVDSRGRPLYKAGEILVQFTKEATKEQIRSLHARLGSRVLDRIDSRRLEKIAVAEGMSETEAVTRYLASDIVKSAERHALRYPMAEPNDPLFSQQWGLMQISAPAGWEFTTGDSNLVVAVIDSGVDYTHPDLDDNIWINPGETNNDGKDNDQNGYVDDYYGWDFAGAASESIPDDADADPSDSAASGHGTHVAGIIAAAGDNGEGVCGTAWQLSIMPLKVKADDSEFFESFHVIEALDYARQNGARIVNCSFGGEASSPQERNAFSNLVSAGILAVCAAGNEGVDLDAAGNDLYPAKYDLENILTVAAGTQSDALAYFSNRGLTSVDVLAPGVSIKSTVPDDAFTEASVTSGGSTFDAIGMQYAGTTGPTGVSGTLYDCGKGYEDEMPVGVSGFIALVERGDRDQVPFTFAEKVTNSKNAGAAAVVIYNDKVDDLDQNGGTLGSADGWIPAVSVPQAYGLALKNFLGQTATVINRVPDSAYAYLQGTSMAAPFVSGLAGLLWSKDPTLTVAQVKSAILNTVDKIPALEGKLVSGGRINAQGALCSVDPAAGDLNCDGRIGLDDAVFAEQILAGMNPYVCRYCLENGTDPVADGAVAFPDLLELLQEIAGRR